jgi:hypothetical protein
MWHAPARVTPSIRQERVQLTGERCREHEKEEELLGAW